MKSGSSLKCNERKNKKTQPKNLSWEWIWSQRKNIDGRCSLNQCNYNSIHIISIWLEMAVSIKLAYRCSTNLFSYNPYITKKWQAQCSFGVLLLLWPIPHLEKRWNMKISNVNFILVPHENEYYWQQLKLFDNIKIMAMLNARLVFWLNKLKRIEFFGRLLIFAGI